MGNTFFDQINRSKSWYLSKVYIIYTKIGAKGSCKMTNVMSLKSISLKLQYFSYLLQKYYKNVCEAFVSMSSLKPFEVT